MEDDLVCTYQNDYSNWRCPRGTLKSEEYQSNFCNLHDGKCQIDDAEFSEAVQSLISIQQDDPAITTIHLDGIHFRTDFSLLYRSFTKRVSFSNAVFYNKVKITDTTFEKGALWGFCLFNDEVEFNRVKFSSIANFSETVFKKALKFRLTNFYGATFVKASFEEGGQFNHSTFDDFASFRNIRIPTLSKVVSFYFIQFLSGRRTWFEEVDLSRISFIECDLRYVKFIDVEWVKPKWPACKRKCLVDEFSNFRDEKLLPKHLERVRGEYQQLKLNYEEARNFADAGDFYYGEMECLRKSLGPKRFLPTLTTIYWFSTGYGEKPLRAGSNLIVLIILWVCCLMSWGLNPTSVNSGYQGIDYEFSWYFSNFSALVKDGLNTFTYVIEILLREEKTSRIYSPVPAQGRWFSGDGINVIGFILVYLQALLFALAVRRRFRR